MGHRRQIKIDIVIITYDLASRKRWTVPKNAKNLKSLHASFENNSYRDMILLNIPFGSSLSAHNALYKPYRYARLHNSSKCNLNLAQPDNSTFISDERIAFRKWSAVGVDSCGKSPENRLWGVSFLCRFVYVGRRRRCLQTHLRELIIRVGEKAIGSDFYCLFLGAGNGTK